MIIPSSLGAIRLQKLNAMQDMMSRMATCETTAEVHVGTPRRWIIGELKVAGMTRRTCLTKLLFQYVLFIRRIFASE